MRARVPFVPGLIPFFLLAGYAAAQTSPLAQPHARIVETVDENRTVTLNGNVHPLALANSSEAISDDTPMQRMILSLKADASQEAQLTQSIAGQNDPKSPLYRHFLTPQEFGAQFGVANADLGKVTSWLQNHGFTIDEVAVNHRSVIFSGTSGQVAQAFQTEIRHFNIAGTDHYANVSDPQIPAALADVVSGIVKLHNFQHTRSISKLSTVKPDAFATPQMDISGSHYLAPADYATIYNINPLYSAGINGAGQSIAVLARSNISVSDVQTYRSFFGLPANNPQIVITSTDPGILDGDSTETSLDTEWSGTVAPNATIKVIVASSTATADGIDLAAQYAVNANVAPIITLSYGSCESMMGTTELSFYNSLWKQAASQGISVMVSSGDSGASCGPVRGINGLCSSPYSTCVGGTEFADTTNPDQYWHPGNSTTGGSAISYIPEEVWNESGSNGGSGLWAGGGGASMIYAKPVWQTGPGVPPDLVRDVPDVSLTASGHDGYLMVQSNSLMAVGGTSASAPSFAGLMALVDQKNGGHQGLANSVLYPLAANQAAGGPPVFHDTTVGNNTVPGVTGYSAVRGYDLASGLGSVDATQLVNNWTSGLQSSLSLSASSNIITVDVGQTVQATITVNAGAAFKSAVTLSVMGAPAGLTAALKSTSIAPPGSGSVALSIAVSSSVKPGNYPITVTAQGGQTASVALSIVIPAPTFALSANAGNLNATAGKTAQVAIATTPQNGFSSPVALSVAGLPSGVTAAFSPATLNGASAASSSLNLTLASAVKAGTYPLVITATGGGISQTSTLSLTVVVPSMCTLTANPTAVSLIAGQSTAVAVSCGAVQGAFAAPLQISVSVPSNGLTVQSATALAAGSSTTMTIGSALTTTAGKYNIALTATASGFAQTLTIPVTVSTPSTFHLTAGSTTVTTKAGTPGQVSVTSAHLGAFASAVSLSATGVPAGVIVSYSKAAFAAPGDGTSVVTFTAAAYAQSGTYSVVLVGAGGGVIATTPLTLIVAANQQPTPAGPNFTFALNTSSMTIQQGGAPGPVIVSTGNFTGGFNSTITISFSGLPVGMNYGFINGSAANNLVNVTEGIIAATYTPAGTYPVTITASGAGIVHSAVVHVTVTQAAAKNKH